jgi:hypothetical protein
MKRLYPQLKPTQEVMAELKDFAMEVDPHASLASLIEVMRMLSNSDLLGEGDPDGERFWMDLYYWIKILKTMQRADLDRMTSRIAELEMQVLRQTKKKKSR